MTIPRDTPTASPMVAVWVRPPAAAASDEAVDDDWLDELLDEDVEPAGGVPVGDEDPPDEGRADADPFGSDEV